MTKVEKKMHSIRETIERDGDFGRASQKKIKYKNGVIGYYISSVEYFNIKYKGFEVNITGDINYPTINDTFGFNLNSWLNEVKRVMRGGKV